MRQLSYIAINQLKDQDDDLVIKAEELVDDLTENQERQLRIILSMAENSKSWNAVRLFMKYQAARKQIDMDWTEVAIGKLEALENDAKSIAATTGDNIKDLHMELISKILGYAIRRHVWNNAKAKPKEKKA
ncbi:MAG TPA: hypothetical protein PLE76_04500 [Rectinema sp.]|jgi:hypothetical protein|nr:hypothetical protein [Rectinema sp.]